MTTEALRVALDFSGRRLTAEQHRALVDHLRLQQTHSVTFIEMGNPGTCATFALDLMKEPAYREIAGGSGNPPFAGTEFMEWLVGGHLDALAAPVAGCLVAYFAGSTWKHVGVYKADETVTSKWGTFPVYNHPLLEVPLMYGDVVRYYAMPAPGEALRHFLEFADGKIKGRLAPQPRENA